MKNDNLALEVALEVRNLTVELNSQKIIKDLTFEVKRGGPRPVRPAISYSVWLERFSNEIKV